MLTFGYEIVLHGLPDIPDFFFIFIFIFFFYFFFFFFFFFGGGGSGCPQTRFSSNVVFIFQKSLNLWKDIYLEASRGSPHGPIEKEMCHLKAENKSFWMFTEPDTISLFCLLMNMYFLFILLPHFVLIMYVPTL